MVPLAQLKAALRIEPDQTADDAELVRLEAAAVAYCERRTGRHFGEPEQLTEVIEGCGGRDLWLTNEPRTVASVAIIGTPGGASRQAIPAEFYTVRGRRLVGAGGWGSASWPHDIEVQYEAGFPDGEAPADLQQAVTQLVALWFELGLPVALGTVAPQVPHNVADILATWTPRRA